MRVKLDQRYLILHVHCGHWYRISAHTNEMQALSTSCRRAWVISQVILTCILVWEPLDYNDSQSVAYTSASPRNLLEYESSGFTPNLLNQECRGQSPEIWKAVQFKNQLIKQSVNFSPVLKYYHSLISHSLFKDFC